MKKIYTSIDLGSDLIKMLVAEIYKGKLNVLATAIVPTKGIKKGLIVDVNETIAALKKAITEIEGCIGIKINKVIANIPADGAEYNIVTGVSTITNEEKRVTANDIVRTLQACVYNKLKSDQELITIMPIYFTLDQKKGLKEPKGLMGKKLAVKAVMVTTPKKNVHSVISVLESLGLKVIDLNISPIADYCEYQNKDTNKGTTAVINIGDQTTTVSVFEKGIIVNSESLKIGGSNVDNDISYIFKINTSESKYLKEGFALANKHYAQSKEVYTALDLYKRELKINQYELSEVVMSRLVEILKLAKKQSYLLTNREINYIIITGGMTGIPGMSSLVKEVFGNKARIGNIETIGIRDNKMATCAGLIKYFYSKLRLRGKEYSMFNQAEVEDLISPQKKLINFSNESMLGKVFGYFFDN